MCRCVRASKLVVIRAWVLCILSAKIIIKASEHIRVLQGHVADMEQFVFHGDEDIDVEAAKDVLAKCLPKYAELKKVEQELIIACVPLEKQKKKRKALENQKSE